MHAYAFYLEIQLNYLDNNDIQYYRIQNVYKKEKNGKNAPWLASFWSNFIFKKNIYKTNNRNSCGIFVLGRQILRNKTKNLFNLQDPCNLLVNLGD